MVVLSIISRFMALMWENAIFLPYSPHSILLRRRNICNPFPSFPPIFFGHKKTHLFRCAIWWTVLDLNQRPLRCQRSALPTELTLQTVSAAISIPSFYENGKRILQRHFFRDGPLHKVDDNKGAAPLTFEDLLKAFYRLQPGTFPAASIAFLPSALRPSRFSPQKKAPTRGVRTFIQTK